VRLASGTELPVLGFGTWPMDDAQARTAVVQAVERGWRLIDTAHKYDNEAGVGQGVRDCGLPREQLFVTTKLNGEWHGERAAGQALAASLDRLGLDYVDLFLIHWPLPWQDRYLAAWRGLLRLREAGLARAVGVSNFKQAHLDRLLAETGVAPEVNQVQVDPMIARPELRAYHEAHGIVTQSWRPLGKGGPLLDDPVITGLAARHGKTPAQVVLRWHLQVGLTAVAKTSHPERMTSNLDVFDFQLTSEDLQALSGLDRGESGAPDSDVTGH
jgi:2,5-diketo-D-gluconate reductase A